MPSPVVIADDHPIFCNGLTDIIESTKKWQVVATANDGNTALAYYQQYKPDIIVLDIHMTGINGLTAAERILRQNPNAHCVMMTMYREAAYCQRALALGVQGYLLKEDAAENILTCFEQVIIGETFVSQRLPTEASDTPPPTTPTVIQPEGLLTERELAVLNAIADLKVNKVIAKEMSISLNTVHNHRQNMCHKLRLSGRQALLQYAVNWKSGKPSHM